MANNGYKSLICKGIIVVGDDNKNELAANEDIDVETICNASSLLNRILNSDDEGYGDQTSNITAKSQGSVCENQQFNSNVSLKRSSTQLPKEENQRKRIANPWRMRVFNKWVRDNKLIYPFKDLLILTKMLHQNPIIWKSHHKERVKYNRAMIEFTAVYNSKCKIFKFKPDLSYFIEGLKQAFNAELTALSTQQISSHCVLAMNFRCECSICLSFQFLKIKSVVDHQRQHNDQLENVYHCKKCMQLFGFQKLIVSYVEHSLLNNKPVGNIAAISLAPKLQCAQCDHSYFHKEMLKAHIYFEHQKEYHQNMNYKCKLCGMNAHTFLKCHLHVRRQHWSQNLEPQHRCFMCGKCFWEKANRRRHIQVEHHISGKFKCKPCKRSYHLHWNLLRHKLHEHKHPKFCFICGRLNYNRGLCAMHTLAEHEFYIEQRKDAYLKPIQLITTKDYECSYCTRCYPKQLLAKHMQLHLTGGLRM